jgi:RNA polymerase sigma-70 factor (ECF subfamily)
MVAVLKSPDTPTQAEFHEVIALRADRWYAACLRITRNPDLAEDAVQDALLSAWNKRHQFERSARLDTWIHRIAVNAALMLIRKSRPGTWEPLEIDVEDERPTPDVVHATEEMNTDLTEALASLSDIERVCFILKHLEQWRLREIAQELDATVGTIKQALFRAVKKLRVSMADLRSE